MHYEMTTLWQGSQLVWHSAGQHAWLVSKPKCCPTIGLLNNERRRTNTILAARHNDVRI